ncbi:HET-domain-containing protein, partial [Trematosphaeria pertusa]
MAEGPLSPAAYRYKALGERHIRLLKVPGSSKDAPAYDLIETSLDAAPPYETISYVWGKQNRSQILTFRTAETVRITPALQVTLSYLRFHCRTGYLWIDQICIDQSNTLECNQQVAIMGEIYGKAQRVLIWLG